MSLNSLPLVGGQTRATYKIVGAITDNDVGKPVKMSATDTVTLCADGDPIYGFVDSVEIGTEGGLVVVGVVTAGRVRVTLDGTVAIGALVEGAAAAAAGTAKPTNWANVSTHTAAAGEKNWMLISGAGTDGTDGTVESL